MGGGFNPFKPLNELFEETIELLDKMSKILNPFLISNFENFISGRFVPKPPP